MYLKRFWCHQRALSAVWLTISGNVALSEIICFRPFKRLLSTVSIDLLVIGTTVWSAYQPNNSFIECIIKIIKQFRKVYNFCLYIHVKDTRRLCIAKKDNEITNIYTADERATLTWNVEWKRDRLKSFASPSKAAVAVSAGTKTQ